jgi:hypothetical protein
VVQASNEASLAKARMWRVRTISPTQIIHLFFRQEQVYCFGARALKAWTELATSLLLVGVFSPGTLGQGTARTGVEHIAQAVRVERSPRMDGTLGDALWQQASPVSEFKQREPYEGQPGTERTEVRVLYSRNEIYFGIACHDSVAMGPIVTQLRRDVSQELDDYFEIVIDSRHDRRNAYVFQINPLGTQRDALITDEQQVSETQDGDTGWDGVWTSEARLTADGWTATVAIPFSTLNFMRSHDVVWGVNFKRFIRRKNEEDLWSGWRRTFGANKISQAGELHGINDIASGRLFIVKPYALGGFSHLPANATASGSDSGHDSPVYRRRRRQGWPTLQPRGQPHRQHGLCRQRRRRAAVQSHSLQIILPREKAVFPRKRRRFCLSDGPQQFCGSALLQPPDWD